MKLWGGRFNQNTHHLVDSYNASIHFDKKLAAFDIKGSIAHVKMLEKCGYLNKEESKALLEGLESLYQKLLKNDITFKVSDEDIHMNIERLLHESIGDVAGKLHTGRSRNDQVALDIHLYLRHHSIIIMQQLHDLISVLHTLAEAHIDTLIPGYTHLQRAEPIRLGHHFLAYFHMFSRDMARLSDNFKRINVCPLGAGALAGSGLDVDRHYVAGLLDFDAIYENSLDAVSDRDFVLEFLSIAATVMMHFSKLSEELILWNSQEFSFISFADAFCTGSSMMPQKKNPDICELARGKTGRVYGALMGLFTVLKSLPLAYNKDMQEDKEGLFDTVQTVENTLAVYTPMLETIEVKKDTMQKACQQDLSNATALANYLVKKDMPFRQAHTITGKIVMHCIEQGIFLMDLPLKSYQTFSNVINDDIYHAIDCENVIEQHQSYGATAKNSVLAQLKNGKATLLQWEKWINAHKKYLCDLSETGDV